MAERPPSVLPRIAALVLVALAATAGMTYAAGSQLGSAAAVPNGTAPTPPLVVPDVRNQAFVFAKGTLEDAGFAWRVDGSVHGYAPNVIVSQTPAAGTRVVDSGAPLITLTLRRNSSYPQAGEATDTSPYQATAPEPADLAGRPIGPAAPPPEAAAPAPPKPLTAAKPANVAAKPATKPAPAKTPSAVTAPQW